MRCGLMIFEDPPWTKVLLLLVHAEINMNQQVEKYIETQ